MSAILPSRTRFLRKPAGKGSNSDSEGLVENRIGSTAGGKSHERSSQSPSRLPTMKGRSATNPTKARPSSSTGNVSSTSSLRPSTARANIGKQISNGGGSRPTSSRMDPTSEPIKQDCSKQDCSKHSTTTTSRHHLRNVSTSNLQASTRASTNNHTRNKSSTLINASTALHPTSKITSEDTAPRILQLEQLKKPVFSTYQQHYSPAKNPAPKPHPATFLAPPSPSKLPSNIAISAETAKLQSELLQLHLLHKDAARVEKEWRASAKRKLGAKFQSVVEKNEGLVQLEVEEMGRINGAALKDWQDLGAPGWGMEEKIQVLGEVLAGVWNLGDSGGKYVKLVKKFERWLRTCQNIRESRAADDGMEVDEVMFIEELDGKWKEECLALRRKLETWKDQVKDLGVPAHGSTLGEVVKGCRGLVNGMLMELTIIVQIERDAVALEVEWIKSINDDVMDDEKVPVAGAAWRLS